MIFNPLLHSFQSQSFLTFFHYVNQSFFFFTTSIPSTTLPKTTCLPSNHGVSTVQMKN